MQTELIKCQSTPAIQPAVPQPVVQAAAVPRPESGAPGVAAAVPGEPQVLSPAIGPEAMPGTWTVDSLDRRQCRRLCSGDVSRDTPCSGVADVS